MSIIKYLLYAILIWNMVVYFLYATDKLRAKGQGRRTPEKTLLICTLACGGIGGFMGVFFLRHKSKRDKFRIVTPLALLLTLAAILLLVWGMIS